MKIIPDRPQFDARPLGADCDACPMKGRNPVPPGPSPSPKLIILSESPGPREEREGVQLIGQAGFYLFQALKETGLKRSDCHLTCATLCRPSHKPTPKEWKVALKCCRPRLVRELEQSTCKSIFVLGGRALQQTFGKASVMAWMGAPLKGVKEFAAFDLLPSMHPAGIIGKPQWRQVFPRFAQRAVDMAAGRLPEWKWPSIVIEEGDVMHRTLRGMYLKGAPVGVDVETGGIDPRTAPLLCIGIANDTSAVSVPWPPKSQAIKDATLCLLASDIQKVMHNGAFDMRVFVAQGIEVGNFSFDTLLAHSIGYPQLEHRLDFVSSAEFAVPKWKTEFRATTDQKGTEAFLRRDELELRDYNAKDAATTIKLLGPLQQRIDETHNGQQLFDTLQELTRIGLKMTDVGVKVSRDSLDEHREDLVMKMTKAEAAFKTLAPDVPLGKNGQSPKLAKYFFETLGCVAKRYTDGGKPKLDKVVLEEMLTTGGQREKMLATPILEFRKASKLIGTYIDGLNLDSRNVVRPNWKCHGTVTGRWSSSGPNFQNQPKGMRDSYVVRCPENYIVAADYSQLELRIMALLSEDEEMIEAFQDRSKDPHAINAAAIYKCSPADVKSAQRNMAKVFAYLIMYGGSASTLWASFMRAGQKISLGAVKTLLENWKKARPKIFEYHMDLCKFAEHTHYIEEMFSGRRRYFHDDHITPSEVVNFPIQAAAGTLMNQAILDIDAAIDWDRELLLAQVHDAAYLEGPDPQKLREILENCMVKTLDYKGLSMRFDIDVGIGKDFKNLS